MLETQLHTFFVMVIPLTLFVPSSDVRVEAERTSI